jgi:uncharacterized ion transporter superfamily protein YfcC
MSNQPKSHVLNPHNVFLERQKQKQAIAILAPTFGIASLVAPLFLGKGTSWEFALFVALWLIVITWIMLKWRRITRKIKKMRNKRRT